MRPAEFTPRYDHRQIIHTPHGKISTTWATKTSEVGHPICTIHKSKVKAIVPLGRFCWVRNISSAHSWFAHQVLQKDRTDNFLNVSQISCAQ